MREQDQDFEPYVPAVMVWVLPESEDRQAALNLLDKCEVGQMIRLNFLKRKNVRLDFLQRNPLKPSRYDLPSED